MIAVKPIPKRLLPDDCIIYVPDGSGGFKEGRRIRHIRFEREFAVSNDEHRSADGGSGKVFIDAVNSDGAFDVPAGSRFELGMMNLFVTKVQPFHASDGRLHHWELTVS